MERLTSFTKEGVKGGLKAAGAGAKGAMAAAEYTGSAAKGGVKDAYDQGARITENTGDVVNNIARRAELIQRGFFRAFVSEEDETDPEHLAQIDGSFGPIGPSHVCLRIETAQHWELKVRTDMRVVGERTDI